MKTNYRLNSLCADWKEWSKSAVRSESGWESDYENWQELMNEAKRVMLSTTISELDFQNLETCWAISEETEDLVEFTKDNLPNCIHSLEELSSSVFPEVRWQVYEAVSASNEVGVAILIRGLDDQDPYCRRRAILSMANVKPEYIVELRKRFSNDPDPLIRSIVAGLEAK